MSIRATTRDDILRLWGDGKNLAQIASASGVDRRTVKACLVAQGLLPSAPPVPEAPPVPANATVSLPAPPSHIAGVPVEAAERIAAARARLWQVLNDANSKGAEVVAAFNALRESEGWGNTAVAALPEPHDAAELAARFRDLWGSYSPEVQELLAPLAEA